MSRYALPRVYNYNYKWGVKLFFFKKEARAMKSNSVIKDVMKLSNYLFIYFLQLYWVYNIVLTTKTYYKETKINK